MCGETRVYAVNRSPQGTRLTRPKVVDKPTLWSTVVLLISSVLLLANGTCSGPHGFSADFPVCVGGQLSVQVWLAIIGLQFTLTASVLLPRLLSIAISQSMAFTLEKRGASLDRLLNSLASAPLMTQIRRGQRNIVLARIAVALVILAVTVLYKFSFVLVNRQDTVLVEAGWVEIGSSPWVPGTPCPVDTWSGDGSVFNNNYRDIVDGTRNSIFYQGTWTTNAISGPSILYVGPSINATSVPQLLNGTVNRCVPAVFTKFTISTALAPSSWSQAGAAFSEGIQFGENPGSPTVDRYISAVGTPDGSLIILPLNNRTDSEQFIPQFGLDYEFIVTVNIQDCWGNFTWNNGAGYQVFEMQEPADTYCTHRDMSDFNGSWNGGWISSGTVEYAQAIISAYFVGGPAWNSRSTTGLHWNHKRAIELFLLALPNSKEPPLPVSMEVSNPGLKAMCDAHATEYNDGPCWFWPSNIGFINGTIANDGTGMTVLGLAMQCFVLMSSLVTLAVIIQRRPALLTEWPAQWLGLVADLPRYNIAAAVAGTSTGGGYVKGGLDEIFLASRPVGQGVSLTLTTTRGDILHGAEHL